MTSHQRLTKPTDTVSLPTNVGERKLFKGKPITELITFSIDNKNLVCKIINEGLLSYSIVSAGLPPPQSAAPPLSFAIGWDTTHLHYTLPCTCTIVHLLHCCFTLALHLHLAYRTLHCVINIVNITNTFNIILIIKHTRQDYMSVHTSYCI